MIILGMEDLKVRLERATINMSRIFTERDCNSIFQYLCQEDREKFAKKSMELSLEKKRLDLERERCNDILGRYQKLVDLGVELDVDTKVEIRRDVLRQVKITPRGPPRTWLNGYPVN